MTILWRGSGQSPDLRLFLRNDAHSFCMVPALQQILATIPGAGAWRLIPDFHIPRLQRRIDAVVVTERAILVFATTRAEAEAAAIDLADFHEGCRDLPVLPVVLVMGERVIVQPPLPFPGAAPAIACTRLLLPFLLAQVARLPALPGFEPAGWEGAAYRPVPALLDAACQLYARHDVAAILLAAASRGDLAGTRAAIADAIGGARGAGRKTIILVTGAPGAGKTLCGLDTVFAPGAEAAFLTGNPALLHVLRAALVRDAASRGLAARAARQRIEAVIQPLHAFRDHHCASADAPPDRVLVIDEAQRCWTEGYARRKTQNLPMPLHASEPALLLDIMGRQEGWCALVCLLGGGQEIHAGEGGLAAWGAALGSRAGWDVVAPDGVGDAVDPRQRLPCVADLRLDRRLHLGTPVRTHRAPRWTGWVDAVLANEPAVARRLAGPDLPVRVTRSLEALRRAVRGRAHERYGLLASTGARRLRAEGVGGLLWHQDEDAVAAWFLDAWPDIRSSDALEVAGTEFGVQGLELDHTGLCWDADLARCPDGSAWQARAFRATAWTLPRDPETLSNRLNAYRVLLTRARRTTTIWVPRGDARDPTRDPARYDAIADYLRACGAPALDETVEPTETVRVAEAALL